MVGYTLSQMDPGPVRWWRLGSKAANQESKGDMGESWTGPDGGQGDMGESWTGPDSRQYSANGQRQVLQGSHAICPIIRQRDLESHDNRLGVAWGVPHLRSLPDGRETQAKEGTASRVGIPAVLWRLTGVRYGHHIALHWRQEGHNLPIRGRLANLQGMQGRRTEEGITAATVVVGTEDDDNADGANK